MIKFRQSLQATPLWWAVCDEATPSHPPHQPQVQWLVASQSPWRLWSCDLTKKSTTSRTERTGAEVIISRWHKIMVRGEHVIYTYAKYFSPIPPKWMSNFIKDLSFFTSGKCLKFIVGFLRKLAKMKALVTSLTQTSPLLSLFKRDQCPWSHTDSDSARFHDLWTRSWSDLLHTL